MSKKTKPQLEAENALLRRARGATAVASIVNNLIRWGGICFIFWCGLRCTEVLAGKQTAANFDVNLLSDLKIDTALAWLLSGGGVVYGWRQSNLRRTSIEEMSKRIKELEQQLDPSRSSSGLTERGETNPEDT